MKKKDFLKQYQTKEWYEASKRIKARDHNTCQMCGHNDRPLSVHHRYYGEGGDILSVPDNGLVTLCERCHKNETEASRNLYSQIDDIKNYFGNHGLSLQLLANMLSEIQYLFELLQYGEDIKQSGAINLLEKCLYNTQYFSDIIACKKIGVDCRELVEHVFPDKISIYDSIM